MQRKTHASAQTKQPFPLSARRKLSIGDF